MIIENSSLYDDIFQFRENICRKVEGRLNVPNHRLYMEKDNHSQECVEILEQILKKIQNKHETIKKILNSFSPQDLWKIINYKDKNKDIVEKFKNLEITETSKERFIDYHDEILTNIDSEKINEFLFRLERCRYEQKVKYEYKKNEKWRSVSSLSPGEKCASLMHLLLAKSDQILIIDQPEDELDYSSRKDLVETIKKRKSERQMIIVSHFQNIPVIADSDLIIEMEEEKEKSYIKSFGCFEKMIQSIFEMEGGFEALKLRFRKYSTQFDEEILLERKIEDAIEKAKIGNYQQAIEILEKVKHGCAEIGIERFKIRCDKKIAKYRDILDK